jgi:hypothetical protein
MGSGVEGPAVLRALQKSRKYLRFQCVSEMKFKEKLRYIPRNPVRRGLVAQPEDWAWSSFRHYLTVEISAVEIGIAVDSASPGAAWNLPHSAGAFS